MSDTDQDYGLDNFGGDDLSGFEEDVSIPIVGTLRVGKVEYAIDLQWNIPVEAGRAASEARQYAAGEIDKPDFYCVKPGAKAQFGLGFSIMGHKPGQPALAAHICNNDMPSFAALFEVEGGYYLLGVNDGLILSDAEQFYANKDDASEALVSLLGMNDFPEVFAPSSMDIEGAKQQSLESVLSGRPSVRLKDINQSSSYIKWGFAIAIAVIVIFGVRYYLDDIEMKRITNELARQAALAQTKVGLKEEEIPIPPMPWENKVQGAKALEACYSEIIKFPLDIPGWGASDLECISSGSGVSITSYLSRGGTLKSGAYPISYAIEMVKDNGLSPRFSAAAGRGTTSNIAFDWSVPNLPSIPIDIQTETVSEITNSLLRIMEYRRTSYIISPADSNQYWRGINITFETNLNPMNYADILEAIPGFMLTSLKFQIDNNNYTIKGKAYEQLPIPIKTPS